MIVTSIQAGLDKVPPQAFVVVSRALQSLSVPVVALLVSTAASLGGEVESAVSFCNVLFVGNCCAALVVVGSFGPGKVFSGLGELTPVLWLQAVGFAAMAALLSALIFMALESTTVTNVVLLARLGPVLYAILGAMMLGVAISRSEWLGFALIGVGVLVTVLVANEFRLNDGDLKIMASALVYALVTLLSKRLLPRIGLPAMVFARNLFSAIIFFFVAMWFYGPEHFADAFYGPLWLIMAVYALVVIVAAQLAWYRALEELTPSSVARWTVMTPALAMAFAFIINHEQPGPVQLVALAFITLGIVVSNLGQRTPKGASDCSENSVAAA